MKIENGGRLKTNIYNKRDVLTFPIVNFPFTSSNISASRAHGVYISQIICYSGACNRYDDFLDKAQLPTLKLLKQGYVSPKLNSSLRKSDGHHHDLVDCYKISISQLTMDLLLFT